MFTTHFYGQEISNYGKENGYVDYRAFAKAFDAVLNNDIMSATWGTCGEWEQESGFIDNSDEIEELTEQIENIENDIAIIEESADINEYKIAEFREKIEEIENEIEILESVQDEQPDVFQWYIIDYQGAKICEEYNEIVYYNNTLDMYLWGVTHYGTSWDYVLTDIPCEKIEK